MEDLKPDNSLKVGDMLVLLEVDPTKDRIYEILSFDIAIESQFWPRMRYVEVTIDQYGTRTHAQEIQSSNVRDVVELLNGWNMVGYRTYESKDKRFVDFHREKIKEKRDEQKRLNDQWEREQLGGRGKLACRS